MYQVYCDDTLLYDPRLKELAIEAPVVELELNKTGSFSFSIYPDHPYADKIKPLHSIILVKKEGRLLFRGRVIGEDEGFYREKKISCEGELSFLLDSRIRPFEFTGSPEDFLKKLLSEHNAQVEAEKQFLPGNITVTDPNDYISRSNESCDTTWENINSRLIKNLGGYLFVRHEADGNYLDYLSDFPYMTTQRITFGENLLDYLHKRNLDEIATGLIPYGAKYTVEETDPETGTVEETTARLTIESVNDGKDYLVDEEAVAKYGTIFTTETWDDVTIAGNLLTKARERLTELTKTEVSLDISAADLSLLGHEFDEFRLGEYVFVDSKPHGMEHEKFLCSKLSINLQEPANNQLTLGKAFETFTDSQNQQNHSTGELVQVVERIESDYVTNEVVSSAVESLYSKIDQSSEEILMEVGSQYVTAEGIEEELNTRFQQTEDSFEFQFNELKTYVENLEGNSETGFEEFRKYIRFEDGNIILGQEGNEITLRIENDRISFLQSGGETAYFANNKLYVTDGQFLNSLQLGNFSFLPRDNGNLSFKWIGGETV